MPPIPQVPKKFIVHLQFNTRSSIWQTMYELFDFEECDGPSQSPFNITSGYPKQGYSELGGVSVWVTNQRKQDIIILSFYSKEEWEKLRAIINDHLGKKIAKIKLATYTYSARNNGWYSSGNYEAKPPEQLVGFDHYISLITNTIDNHLLHVEFIKSVGEMKALNFLLRGLPGMGKTSLVKLIATKYNAPICIVNPQGLSAGVGLDKVLNPTVSTTAPIIILLFEDFDRFLCDQEGDKIMNHLLNGIDGVNNKSNVVRFFTGNDCKTIVSNKALINRITHTCVFGDPTREMYKMKMKQLFAFHETYDEDLAEKFLDKVCKQKPPMSMRPFITHILMYLFEERFSQPTYIKIKYG